MYFPKCCYCKCSILYGIIYMEVKQMDNNIINFEDKRKLLESILIITGNNQAAFYNLQQCMPSLKNITWEQVQLYRQSLEQTAKDNSPQKHR